MLDVICRRGSDPEQTERKVWNKLSQLNTTLLPRSYQILSNFYALELLRDFEDHEGVFGSPIEGSLPHDHAV